MPISPYLAKLRAKVGQDLLLLPAVAVVIRDEHHRLLLVRDRASGDWGLPAGGMEPAETPLAAARRELREETGLEPPELALRAGLGGDGFRHTYPNGDRVEYAIFVFAGAVSSDELASGTDPDEIVEMRFFARNDAPPLTLPYPWELLWASR